jgi:excisionase family DNA binding protein
MGNDTYMTTKEAAEKLGYTTQHTRLLIRQGKLEGSKFGRDWMVVRESVEAYQPERRTSEDADD